MKDFYLCLKKIYNKKLIFIFVLFVLFFLKGYFLLDSDFGWHLKMGELIMQKGIPKTDPFSYTMPSYPFVDHEWFSNIIIAFLYSHIGIIGLCLIFSTCAIVAIMISVQTTPQPVSSIVFFMIGVILLSFVGIRVQVLSWIYCAFLLLMLFRYKKEKYIKYSIPFGILLWSNTHGSFPLGLIILFLFYLSKHITGKQLSKNDIIIFICSIFVTFFPPYGWRRWWEVWMQISDGGLRWNVQEWGPLFFSDFNIALICYFALSISLLIRYFNKIDFFIKTIYLLFLLMAISSIRHIPLWLCISSFQVSLSLRFLYKEIKIKVNQQKISTFLQFFLLIACGIQIVISSVSLLYEIKQNPYPEKAVKYLIKNNIEGNVLSIYNWGGYLIWKYPNKKVFIDGRMPSWRWKALSNKESDNAFFEWKKLLSGKNNLNNAKQKYNIEIALIPTQEKMYICKKPLKWDTFFKGQVISQENDVFKSANIIYQDKVATVYSLN